VIAGPSGPRDHPFETVCFLQRLTPTTPRRTAPGAAASGLTAMTRLALSAAPVFAAGCAGRPQSEIDRGRQAIVAALDSWEANEPVAKLKSLPDPVEFSEELRATHTLTDYELGKVDDSDKSVIRYTVTLTLKGKESRREVVFAVALKNPVVVARDPYY
jgi:hypothetical protein